MPGRAVSIYVAALFRLPLPSQHHCLAQAEELEVKLKFISEKVPNRICQVMGSNAGAGSGEFHMYRMVSPCITVGNPTGIVPAFSFQQIQQCQA